MAPRARRERQFIRSSHIVCYWTSGSVVLHNYATGRRLLGTKYLHEIADACGQPRSLSDLLRIAPDLDRTTMRAMIARLCRAQILFVVGARTPRSERAMAAFRAWNPAAGFFHTSTKDVPFGERGEGERRQRQRAVGWPMPPPVKRYPGRSRIRLPAETRTGEWPAILLARRTWRRFGSAQLPVEDFATLLGLTAGIRAWAPVAGAGRVALRTSPSGGARHPIEVYVLALRVAGVPKGLYHYAADRHALESLRRGAPAGCVEQYLPGQPWYDGAAALVFFSVAFERSLWRYDYSRAYRAVLIEAGHLCQTFCLTATWLGLAPFCSMAIADRAVEQDLGLDGILESVVYAAGVGVRPAGMTTATAPKGVRQPRFVDNPVFRTPPRQRRTSS